MRLLISPGRAPGDAPQNERFFMSSANQPPRASTAKIVFWSVLWTLAGVFLLVMVIFGFKASQNTKSLLRSLDQIGRLRQGALPQQQQLRRTQQSQTSTQEDAKQEARQMAEAIAAGSGWTPEELAEIVRLDPQLEAKSWELYRRGVDSLQPDEKLLVYSLVKLPYARAKRERRLPLTDKERQILQFGDAHRIP
jgi:hypothetical protein